MNELLVLSEEVAQALRRRKPVVALETTLVTHGLPPPQGLEAALELEEIVRAGGAVPATVGILDGAVRVGLARAELERLAAARDVAKVNLGNLAAVVASGAPGSPTVAATMFVAAQAGIRVFATGGIGGVHRDVAESGDVSADLVALGRFPVAVVCAGAKAILDLPRTVEMLETLGVPLRTTEMELRTEDPRAPDVRVGKIFDRNWELLSWLIPMALVRGIVLGHYRHKVEDLVFTNLSRLASQWADIVNASLLAL